MAPAIVGTIGTATQGTSGASVSPSFGASENRTAGNLLILFCSVTGTATLPTTPTGWVIGKQVAGTSCSSTVYFKQCVGGEANSVTISGITSGIIAAQLAEFSGVVSGAVDQSGSATATTSPVTATNAGADTASGGLQVMAGADFRSVARSPNDTWTSNHITTPTAAGNNNGTSSANHYSFSYGVNNSNVGADTAIMTLSVTTSITGLAVVDAVFKPGVGTFQQFGQAQADIKATSFGKAQAQADIKATSNGFAQANAMVTQNTPTASDTFTRTTSNGWGTADTGGPWTIKSGTVADYSTDGSTGKIAHIESGDKAIVLGNVMPVANHEIYFTYALSALPSAGTSYILDILTRLGSNADPFAPDVSLGGQLTISETGDVQIAGEVSTTGLTSSSGTYGVGQTWAAKVRILQVSTQLIAKAKSWNITNIEPDWTSTKTFTITVPLGHFSLDVNFSGSANSTTLTVDNFSIVQAFPVSPGQAQAKINSFGVSGFGQAQADIKATSFGKAQAQADINATSFGKAQAQADILVTSFGEAQARADIKQTYFGLGQAQARILATSFGLAQSQADILATSFGLGQSQADIKQTSFGLGQAQADILKTQFAEAQAQAAIKAVGNGLGQATADILATSFGQAQAQADIKVTSFGLGQSQGYVRPRVGLGQAQALLNTGFGLGQSVAAINGNFFIPFSDTFTRSVSNSLGTSDNGDTWSLSIGAGSNTNVNGSQATIVSANATEQRWELNRTYISGGQEVSIDFSVDKTPNSASITAAIGSITRAIAGGFVTGFTISQFSNGTMTVTVRANGTGSGQSGIVYTPGDTWTVKVHIYPASNNSALLRLKTWKVGDAEPGWFSTVSNAEHVQPGHPMIDVLGDTGISNAHFTWTFDNFQIIEAHITQYAQAQAFIIYKQNGFGQAQADIRATSFGFGQANADIKATSFGLGQAQAYIRPRVGLGQAQALLNRHFGLGQAAALINGTSFIPFLDTFTRTASNSLGTSDNGETWQVWLGTAANFSVDGSKGVVVSSSSVELMSRLRNTLILGNRGIELSAVISVDKIPLSTLTSYIGIHDASQSGSTSTSSLGIFIQPQTNGSLFLGGLVYGNGQSVVIPSYTPGDFYHIKVHFYPASNNTTLFRVRAWKVGNVEPGWQVETSRDGIFYGGHPEIDVQRETDANQPYTFTYDDLQIIEANITAYGQAQAYIKVEAISGLGQAQADIDASGYGFGQAQADIKATSFGFGQSQAQIHITQGYGQSQADILTRNFGLGQAQATLATRETRCGQAQAQIFGHPYVFGQAQASIKVEGGCCCGDFSSVLGNDLPMELGSDGPICRNLGFGQAQASIVTQEFGEGQAQTLISRTEYGLGQAQADVKATGYGEGQAQADIKTTNYSEAQAQADILAKGYGFGQAQAKIKITSYGEGQSQADIKVTEYGFGQAQSAILANAGYGQAQGTVKAVAYGEGQAIAYIAGQNLAYGQAQSDIKAINRGYGQAQSDIKVTGFGFGQAQARVQATYSACGNAQASIKATSFGEGQSQADIKATSFAFGQAQAYIKLVQYASGQAQTSILAVGRGFGQSQSDIKQTYTQSGNAQSDIKVTVISTGQVEAQIKANYAGFGQALALIDTIAIKFGQAQASIVRPEGYGQAQAYIFQPHILKNLTVSDSHTLRFSMSDSAVDDIAVWDSRTVKVFVSDSGGVSVKVSDSKTLNLTLSDAEY